MLLDPAQMYRHNAKRTTVILDQLVWALAEENMRLRGYNRNFSAYIADLIRRDLEMLTPEQRMILREAAEKKWPKKGVDE